MMSTCVAQSVRAWPLRGEQAHLPEAEGGEARAAALRAFLARKGGYEGAEMRACCEEAARYRLARSLAERE